MSFHATSAALKVTGLEPGEKFLLVVMASYANTDNTLFPSQRVLSDDTGIAERTIRKHLVSLEARGLIHRLGRRLAGRRTSDLFTLLFLPAESATGRFRPPATSAKTSGIKVQKQPAKSAAEPIREPIIEPKAREAVLCGEPASRAFDGKTAMAGLLEQMRSRRAS